jgi:hypothetical protein
VDGIHGLLTAFATDSRAGKVPLEKFVITKGLNKAPKDYPDAKSQPHLQVQHFLLLWLRIRSGFLVVFEKPNRSSFPFPFTAFLGLGAPLPACLDGGHGGERVVLRP